MKKQPSLLKAVMEYEPEEKMKKGKSKGKKSIKKSKKGC